MKPDEPLAERLTEDTVPIAWVGAPGADPAALTRDIAAEVRRKGEAGLYPSHLSTPLEAPSDPLAAAVEDLRRAARLPVQPALASPHRVLGAPFSLAKRGMRLGLRWYTQWLVEQMSAFASSVAALGAAVEERFQRHDAALRELRGRLDLAAPEQPNAASDPAPLELALERLEVEGQALGGDLAAPPRWREYVELFPRARGPVLDLGCGSGGFLAHLQRSGLPAYGAEARPEMAQRARERGLDVRGEDPLGHLASVAPGSLGGIFVSQFGGRPDLAGSPRLYTAAAGALGQDGVLVVEALHPGSLSGFPNSLYVDLGRVRPVHPETLVFLAETAGFADVQVRYGLPGPRRPEEERAPRGFVVAAGRPGRRGA